MNKKLTHQHLHLCLSHSKKSPKKKNPKKQRSFVLSDDADEEDVVQKDELIPHLGWTMKVWYNLGCESSISHHRLMGILQTYYVDWDVAVEYVCNEHTHRLEDTYWKTRVCISIKDEQMGAYQLDSNYAYHAHYATMEDSIEDAVAEACIGLRGR